MDYSNFSQAYRAEPRKKTPIPTVRLQCICRNEHRPIDGFVYTSPSCLQHGPRAPYITHDSESGFYVVDDRSGDGLIMQDVCADLEKECLADAVGQCGKRLFADGAAVAPSTSPVLDRSDNPTRENPVTLR